MALPPWPASASSKSIQLHVHDPPFCSLAACYASIYLLPSECHPGHFPSPLSVGSMSWGPTTGSYRKGWLNSQRNTATFSAYRKQLDSEFLFLIFSLWTGRWHNIAGAGQRPSNLIFNFFLFHCEILSLCYHLGCTVIYHVMNDQAQNEFSSANNTPFNYSDLSLFLAGGW